MKRPVTSRGTLNGWQIEQARQQIRFKLDERGAVLRSSARICMSFGFHKVDHYIFDKPFLVFLRYKSRKEPYFALWVDNPEILLPYAVTPAAQQVR